MSNSTSHSNPAQPHPESLACALQAGSCVAVLPLKEISRTKALCLTAWDAARRCKDAYQMVSALVLPVAVALPYYGGVAAEYCLALYDPVLYYLGLLRVWQWWIVALLCVPPLLLYPLVKCFRWLRAAMGRRTAENLNRQRVRKILFHSLKEKMKQIEYSVSILDVSSDDWAHVDCPVCRAGLEASLPLPLGAHAAKVWEKRAKKGATHSCYFDGGKDDLTFFLALTYWRGVWDRALRAKGTATAPTPEVTKPGLPEMPNVNKARKQIALNEMRAQHVRAPKIVKTRMEDDDYNEVVNLVWEGCEERAIETAEDACYVDPEDEEEFSDNDFYDDLDEGHGERDRGLSHRGIKKGPTELDIARRRNLKASQKRARQVVDNIKSKMPESDAKELKMVDTDHFFYSKVEDIPEVQSAWLARCRAVEENHHRVTAERCPPASSKQPENKERTADEKAKRKKKSKVVVEQVKRETVPESTSRGSKMINHANYGVRAVQLPHQWKGHTYSETVPVVLNGIAVLRESNRLWFITCRHETIDGKLVDRFRNMELPMNITWTKAWSTMWCPGVIVEARCDSDDRIAFRIEGMDAPSQQPKAVDAREYIKDANAGRTVDLVAYVDGEWKHAHGEITQVTPSGHVHYAMSTTNGCCRAPVFTPDGRVIGGHYHPGLSIRGVTCPGSEPEPLTIPAKWEKAYKPSNLMRLLAGKPPQNQHRLPRIGKTAGHVERRKIFTLKRGVSEYGVEPKWVLGKPSTEMLHKEIHRFAEPADMVDIPDEVLKEAIRAVNALESTAFTIVTLPDVQQIAEVIREMGAKSRTSAGAAGEWEDQHSYVCERGGGDFEAGIDVLAEETFALQHWICEHGKKSPPPDHPLSHVYQMNLIWSVQGKKDGYAHAGEHPKIDVGRSIQAPSFHVKVLWKAMMKKADDRWCKRDGIFRTGYDFNRPTPTFHVREYLRTLFSLALDESAYDRYIPRILQTSFFFNHLPYINRGIPSKWLEFMEDIAGDSIMRLSDGTIYQKYHGNPSGFMNTLRLNCYVQLLVWCIVLIMRMRDLGEDPKAADVVALISCHDTTHWVSRDIFLELCGDDSRANAITERGCTIMDMEHDGQAIEALWNKHFPAWKTRREGYAHMSLEEAPELRLVRMPPLISRGVACMHGYVWTPLLQPSRAIKRLVHEEDRTVELQVSLETSAWATMALHLLWEENGDLVCPPLEFLREYDCLEYRNMVNRLGLRYYNEALTTCTPVRTLEQERLG